MPDKKDFIAIFNAESQEHLTNLDNGLVELEKKPVDIELLKELNREAHTLKGSARVFGYYEIQDIAHKIEDIFDKIIQKKIIFKHDIADRIFKGLDLIREILGMIAKEEAVNVDISGVCRELEVCLEKGGAQPDKGQPEQADKKKEKIAPNKAKEKKKTKPSDKQALKKQEAPEPPAQFEETNKAKEPPEHPVASKIEEYIRIPVSRVNALLNLVGEIVINKMKSSQKIIKSKRLDRIIRETQKNMFELNERIKRTPAEDGDDTLFKLALQCGLNVQKMREEFAILSDNISAEALHLDPVIDELQEKTKEIRMLPCSTIFEAFPRMIRDISSQEGKDVHLEIYGEETELDKKVLEGMKSPLMHILRNCVDHGIELPGPRISAGKPAYGTIKLSAYHEAGNVLITVEDDGRGIDIDEIKRTLLNKRLITEEELSQMAEKEILNAIFMNGYSTSPIITDVSGRGIGLDVVRREIDNLKGSVVLETEKGKSTKFTLILPLTIAIIQVLLVKVRGVKFAFPMPSIKESLKVKQSDIFSIEGKMAIQAHGHTVPAVKLEDILDLSQAGIEAQEKKAKDELSVVIATSLDKKVGFVVDEIIGEEEIFIKSFNRYLGKVKNVSGATILVTGEVVVILDVEDLIAQSRLSHPALSQRKFIPRDKRKEKRILVVEDAISTRELEKSILEAHGFLVDTAVDGIDALDKLSQGPYSLVISDIMMPRMNGFELCRAIKNNEQYKNIPVIIVTSLEKDEDKRRGIEVGAQAYIVKRMFDQSNLLDTIERLIGG